MRHHNELATLAANQHGVVSHSQLRELGYSNGAIGRAVTAGRLHWLDRGVYAVGHVAVSSHGTCLAAVLAAGAGAVVSHASAAWLWGLHSAPPHPPHITLPSRGHAKARAQIHHSTVLETEDLAVENAIPVTAVPRTLLDYAATQHHRRLANAIERSERRGLLDVAAIDLLAARCGRHRGKRPLLSAIEIYRVGIFSRSRAERLFFSLVEDAGLPKPAMNYFVAGHEIDAYWEAERFAVEVDGWGAHRGREAFETDPVRQEDLKLAGIDSVRFTARRIEREPRKVGERLARLLNDRRRSLKPPSHP